MHIDYFYLFFSQKIKSSLTGFEKIFNDFQDIIKATKVVSIWTIYNFVRNL